MKLRRVRVTSVLLWLSAHRHGKNFIGWVDWRQRYSYSMDYSSVKCSWMLGAALGVLQQRFQSRSVVDTSAPISLSRCYVVLTSW